MTLHTALVIGGDAAGAIGAADGAAGAVERLETAERGAIGAADAMAGAQTRATAAAGGLSRELERVRAEADPAAAAARKLARETDLLDTALAHGIVSTDQHAARLKVLQRELSGTAGVSDRAAAGSRNLGQQFGDLAVQIQGGISPARAFATQAAQMGYALSEMGGAAGAVGGFLVGPWGIALTIAVSALAPLIEELISAKEAMFQVEIGASAVTSAQSVLGEMFDLTTGKLQHNTEALRLNAQAQALNLLASSATRRAKAEAAIDAAGEPGVRNRVAGAGQIVAGLATANIGLADRGADRARGNNDVRLLRDEFTRVRSITDEGQRAAAEQRLMLRAYATDFTGSGTSQSGFVQAIADRTGADADRQTAFQIQQSLNGGVLATGLRRDAKDKKPKKTPDHSVQIAEFGRDAAARLAGIGDQFDDTPPAVRRVNAALRSVDDLIDDALRKKPPNLQQLLTDAEQLRGTIRDGLTEPLRDFVDQQQQAYAVGEALLAGDTARAEALKIIAGLERQMGPLTTEQKAAVLGTVQALDAQARQLDILHAKQQVYLDGLGQIRGIVDDATQAFVRGDLGQFLKSPGKLLDAFQTVQADAFFNRMFDGLFRDLQDQATGTSVIQDASARMADAVDLVARQTDRTTDSLGSLERAASGAASAVGARGVGGAAGGGTSGIPDVAGLVLGATGLAPIADIVVQARRPDRHNPTQLFTDAIGGLATRIGGIFTDPDKAARIGSAIGKTAGRGLEGAATGAFVSGIANSLGIRTSGTGAQLGGAIGGFLPIPGGAVVGSLLGGLAGSLFKPAPKYGTAQLTGSDSAAISGNAGSARGAAGDLAGAVQAGIAQIAEQLGGTLGNYSTSIGTFDGKYRVNTNATSASLNYNNFGASTLHDFGKDGQQAAIGYAIADAVADGAVQGLSARVAKALQSSSDLDKALREALKVQNLELAIGGFAAEAAKAFREFEAQAKDRLRIATQYGFDVVAIEQRNADDRTALQEQLLKSQVGSLQSLVDELTQGSLFEGSALDKIGALDTAIAKAKADLAAGVGGAGDTLSGLYQQRLSSLKEAYGTTGGFAGGYQDTLADARAAIARTNAQISAAAAVDATSDPALKETNSTLDEISGQQSKLVVGSAETNALLGQLLAQGQLGDTFNLAKLGAY